jgi:hypothetical protein
MWFMMVHVALPTANDGEHPTDKKRGSLYQDEQPKVSGFMGGELSTAVIKTIQGVN